MKPRIKNPRPHRTDPRVYVTLRDGLRRRASYSITLQNTTMDEAIKVVAACAARRK